MQRFSTDVERKRTRICLQYNEGRRRVFEKTHGAITLGTGGTNTVELPAERRISDCHGTIECTNIHGIWVYIDHSSEGTVLNDLKRLLGTATILNSGDILQIGDLQLSVSIAVSLKPKELSIPTPIESPSLRKTNTTGSMFIFQSSSAANSPPHSPTLAYSSSPVPNAAVRSPTRRKRPDNLRIQVSKKMAGIRPSKDTTRPSSPVPQQAIKIQQKLLQRSLTSRKLQDELLLAQQEEWLLRTHQLMDKSTGTEEDERSVSSSAETQIQRFRESFEENVQRLEKFALTYSWGSSSEDEMGRIIFRSSMETSPSSADHSPVLQFPLENEM